MSEWLQGHAWWVASHLIHRDPPIMFIILPIMLCCTAQNFAYYALIYAPYLPIMLRLCSIFIPKFLVNLHFMGKQ